MKHLSVVFSIILGFGALRAQGVLVSPTPGGTPDPSAILELNSTQQGFLLPRLTQTQRNAIQSPAIGLQIYNVTSECVEVFMPSGWVKSACNCPAAPNANFTSLLSTAGTGATVVFTPSQSGLSYQWSATGGNPATGSGNSFSTSWSVAGTYQVILTVTDPLGCSNADTNTITVVNCTPGTPVSTFNFSPNPGNTVSPVTFTPSASSGVSYAWSFSGGNPSTSSQANPSVVFNSAGTYTASLTTTDLSSGCTSTSTQNVVITACQTGGSASFSFSGGIQNWTVPPNVCQITVNASGAGGGGGTSSGGSGGRITATIPVTPGTQYRVIVGGAGGPASGRAGGGGGGFSGLLTTANAHVVTAGGGGGAPGSEGCSIGNGGDGGGGTGGSGPCGSGGLGGNNGANPAGGAGGTGNFPGGAGNVNGGGNGGNTTGDGGTGGGGGGFGLSGGISQTGSCTFTAGAGGYGGGGSGGTGGCGSTQERLSGGGGGGGGFTGGGGGNTNIGCSSCGCGSGGGGSNYAIPGATNVNSLLGGGASSGSNGAVTITW